MPKAERNYFKQMCPKYHFFKSLLMLYLFLINLFSNRSTMRYLPYYLVLFALLLAAPMHAQQGNWGVGAAAQGGGGTVVMLSDANAVINNPSSMVQSNRRIGIGLSIENRFSNADFIQYALAGNYQLNTTSAVGIGIQVQGGSLYNQKNVFFSYGRSIASKISIGLAAVATQYAAANYGSAFTINAKIGAHWQPLPQLRLASTLSNPFTYTLGDDYKTTSELTLGAAYQPSTKIVINTEVAASNNQIADLRFGIHYQPKSIFVVRMGYSSAAASYTFGCGITKKGMNIDLFAKTHPLLKLTSGVSLAYQIPSTKSQKQ